MPAKRRRSKRDPIPRDVQLILGLGSGISHIPEAQVRDLWAKYGEGVTRIWFERFGKPPFMAAFMEARDG